MKFNKYFLSFSIIIFLTFEIKGQEICNNGIDDDNNGLIDLNDPSCYCYQGLILNSSFEDTVCCPSDISQMYCLSDWVQASTEATTDYFNFCDFTTNTIFPIPPVPLIDGEGFVGFWNGRESSNKYKEYIGICLPVSMLENRAYTLNFYLGFGGKNPISQYSSDNPIEIGIYGNSQCYFLPFEGFKCPIDSDTPGWIELGSQFVFGEINWVKVEFDLLPNMNINALAIGPSCNSSQGEFYYYLDQVCLFEKNKNYEIELVSGSPCDSVGILRVQETPGATYQWYLDGVAIMNSGMFENEISVSEEGMYNVVLTIEEDCILSRSFDYCNEGHPNAELGEDRSFCSPQNLILGENNLGKNYLWNTGETTAKIIIDEPGSYSVTVSNHCGESYDSVNILPCESCDMLIPNVFTPNNDGFNDTFGGFSDCPVETFYLSIYSRWGEKVFETIDYFNHWDGKIKDEPALSDVYIWRVIYTVVLDGELMEVIKNGEVALLR